EEISPQRTGRAAARANLLLQHGLLRRASGQLEIGPGPPAHQLQNGSVVPRDREEGPRSRIGSRTDLGWRDGLGRIRRKCGRHKGHPSMLQEMQLDPDQLRARFEPLFRENFEKFGELGAAVSVWQNGEPVLHLHRGFRDARYKQLWEENTIVLIWSATKGLSSACLLHALQEHKIDIERRAGELWPEFAQAGKEEITLAQLVSHQAGLAALDRKVDILDYPAVIDALERQEPNWPPGSAHGYHARTVGFLLDELVRRVAGVTLAEYWQKTFAEPLGLDLWIGLPE